MGAAGTGPVRLTRNRGLRRKTSANPRPARGQDCVASFLGLCGPHLRPAFNLALILTGDQAVAADLCEEAVAAAYSLDAPSRLVILRGVVDASRTLAKSAAEQVPSPLATVPAGPRAALWLHDRLGLSDEEAAYVCRLSVPALRTQVSQARAACGPRSGTTW